MSVFIYSDEELAGLWHRLGGDEELHYAIHALGIANRAAYMLSYAPDHDDGCAIEVPRFETPAQIDQPVSTWSALDWAQNLLYNCVSNGGTDFAPPQHRVKLLVHARIADACDEAPADVAAEPAEVPW